MGRRGGRAWIGVSGYDYPHWGKGALYPKNVPRRSWLSYAARIFNSVELNGTFYSLKNPDVFRRWVELTPDRGFVFAVKGSRYITHRLKLRNAEQALANFFASGILLLGRKTGPFLWQLPDSYRFDPARIEGFLDRLPWSSQEAEPLARQHDHRLKDNDHAAYAPHDAIGLRERVERQRPAALTAEPLRPGRWLPGGGPRPKWHRPPTTGGARTRSRP
jgi:uncharacterized protein YecE (DUF72 family)